MTPRRRHAERYMFPPWEPSVPPWGRHQSTRPRLDPRYHRPIERGLPTFMSPPEFSSSSAWEPPSPYFVRHVFKIGLLPDNLRPRSGMPAFHPDPNKDRETRVSSIEPVKLEMDQIKPWNTTAEMFLNRNPRKKRSSHKAIRPDVRDTISMAPMKLWDCEHKRTISSAGRFVKYCCLSYVWTQISDDDLRNACKTIARETRVRYFWIDRWCIDQSNEEEKAKEVPRMGEYYGQANLVVALIPEITETVYGGPKNGSEPFEAVELAQQNKEPTRHFARSKWVTRVWTFQEAASGAPVGVLTGSNQLVSATLLDAMRLAIAREHLDEAPLYLVNLEQYSTNLDRQKNRLEIQGVLILDHFAYKDIRAAGRSAPFDTLTQAWKVMGERHCQKEYDKIYGVLGLVQRARISSASYNAPSEDILLELAKNGMDISDFLNASMINDKNGLCWMPGYTLQPDEFASMESRLADGRVCSCSCNGLWVKGVHVRVKRLSDEPLMYESKLENYDLEITWEGGAKVKTKTYVHQSNFDRVGTSEMLLIQNIDGQKSEYYIGLFGRLVKRGVWHKTGAALIFRKWLDGMLDYKGWKEPVKDFKIGGKWDCKS
ncbi:hypothetical protein PFICI_02036 [Pestalotiopsis fici W106-1]|uniref:Heterokaryon incompatibility domain-containing protein n=1 Tax=Pestalotiopsis fici (strain W106-1 / CGMCC3.15140) TaxID=1229662 RepID=W3XQ85_PESFW|nr:uncharacterized protein PFICI_02036 [Pestalotiopsis fici W106-1]ETS88208.1 hypothetical protein PFICI_02036 [Pestalotiopsis fici W106-1]